MAEAAASKHHLRQLVDLPFDKHIALHEPIHQPFPRLA
jgi:hypothetical protein